MIKRCNALSAFLCFYLFSFPTGNTAPVSDKLPEIHLVTDISGNMKHTAPNNQRVNAIRMFHYLANKDSSRSIKIDPSIHEFTLVFQKNSAVKDLYLTNPEGKKRSITKEDHGILATKHYEVIKIKEPLPGEWILSGPKRQMERVIILTDIKLNTNFTTGVYFDKELLTLNGSIAARGKTITSNMITEHMKMNLELKNKNHKFSYVIPYGARGLFGNNLIMNIPADTYKATWSANNNYLSRERQFMIVVQNLPFDLAINKEHDSLMIHLLKPDLIKENSVAIKIIYKDVPKEFPLKQDKLIWVYNLKSLCHSSDFSEADVLIQLSAATTSGRNVLFKLFLNGQLCGKPGINKIRDEL